MMKKIIYASLISALLAPAVQANEPEAMSSDPKTCANFNGFYAGLLLGYGSGAGKTNPSVTVTPAAGGAVTTLAAKNNISVTGANGGIILGYGKAMGTSKVYLGLDIGLIFDGAKGKSDLAVGTQKISRKESFEMGVRMGFAFANALPFFKVGWVNSKVEGQYQVQGVTLLTQKYLNSRLNGAFIGLGIDTKVASHVLIGVEYTYTCLPKKGKQFTFVDPAGDNYVVNAKTQLNDNKFRVKLAYQF